MGFGGWIHVSLQDIRLSLIQRARTQVTRPRTRNILLGQFPAIDTHTRPTFPLFTIELNYMLSSISYSQCLSVMFWEQCIIFLFQTLGSLHLTLYARLLMMHLHAQNTLRYC